MLVLAHSPRKKSQHHPTFDLTLLPTAEHICGAPDWWTTDPNRYYLFRSRFSTGFALVGRLPFQSAPRKTWLLRGGVRLIEENLPIVGMYPGTAVAMIKKIEQGF
jgi:hypothetical protein